MSENEIICHENKRGTFIVFEGIDRCGKTSQIQKLVTELTNLGKKVIKLNFPDRTTPIGKLIDNYLKEAEDLDDHVIHLLFSANRWEFAKQIKSYIEEGYIVISDRYVYSGIVFSSSKGLNMKWCTYPDCGLPAPDFVIFLEISIDESMKRGSYGSERYEKEEFQRKVASNFFALMKKFDNWLILNAEKTFDELHTEIIETVTTMINYKKDQLKYISWF